MIGTTCEKCSKRGVARFFVMKKDEETKEVCTSCKEQLEKEGWECAFHGMA